MAKKIFPRTIFVFSLVFQYGFAIASNCSVSPVNTVIYFDLEQFGQLAIQQGYNDKIHSPILCEGGNDTECSKQQCCEDEVGCCYSDNLNKQSRKCGCKKLKDKSCTYPAPLAILAKSQCDTEKHTKTSVCLREKRENEENYILLRNTALGSFAEPKTKVGPYLYSYLVLKAYEAIELIYVKTSSSANLPDEQLSLITLQESFNEVIQSPQTCVEETGGDCSKQQCCHGEVGCCYNNGKKHIRKCGCKKPQDKTCAYPAPLAILANSECDDKEIRNSSACLREKRGNEESFISTNDSSLQAEELPGHLNNIVIDIVHAVMHAWQNL